MAKKTNIALIILVLGIIVSLLTLPKFYTSPTDLEEEEEETEEIVLELDEEYYGQFKGENREVIVYNWGEYISDGSDGMMDINEEFTKATGINVIYLTFSTNEELYAKLMSGNAGYDVVIPSDYMIGKMIEKELIQPLDFSKLPNIDNIEDRFRDSAYDPGGKYSAPYTWGITGIIYNTKLLKDNDVVDSWDILWDEDYKGEILMFSNSRDAFGIAEKKLGFSLNTENQKELKECLDELKKQKPLVQAYVMDEIFDKMLIGEATLAPYYAGDALTMIQDNPDLAFAMPKEGVNIFVDATAIPVTSPNPDTAHMYINFLMEAQVAAANAEYIGYATPNEAAKEFLDEEILQNPIAYPPADLTDNAEYYLPQSRETSILVDQLWTELLSADQVYNQLLVPTMLVLAILLTIGINIFRAQNKKKKQYY